MFFLKSLRVAARYNVLTPIAALVLAVSPALADQTVATGDTVTDIVLGAGENLTNSGTINDNAGATPVSSGATVGTITNNAGATIENTVDGRAIDVSGAAGLVNSGVISGTGAGASPTISSANGFTSFINNSGGLITSISGGGGNALAVSGTIGLFSNAGEIRSANGLAANLRDVTTFRNLDGGLITGGYGGVWFSGNVGSFSNAGEIRTFDEPGVYVSGGVTTFSNAAGGEIRSTQGAAIDIDGGVATFSNAGEIASQQDDGVQIGGAVGSFSNLTGGTISSDFADAIVFNNSVGSFSNAGEITSGDGYGAHFFGTVTTFSNAAGGSIESYAVGASFGGGVGSFSNAGEIVSTDDYGVNFNGDVTTFSNTASGTITGGDWGVNANGRVGSFSNAGQISGSDGVYLDEVGSFANLAGGRIWAAGAGYGVYVDGSTTGFSNAGTIESGNSEGVHLDGGVTTFANLADGSIEGYAEGVSIIGVVGSFSNAGQITSMNDDGVDINGAVTTFSNAGTISSAGTAVSVKGVGNFINSGVLRGNTAFLSVGSFDDKLTLLTGSEIYGQVDFGGGNDTFDFSGFYGTAVLQVQGLEAAGIVNGNQAYATALDGSGDGLVAIYDPTGATAMGFVTASTAGSIFSALFDEMGGATAGPVNSFPNGYMAERRPTAAEAAANSAVLSELDVGQPPGGKIWGKVFGGFSADQSPVELSNVFGGLVGGAHFEFDTQTRLGGLGGYSRSHLDIASGQQTIDTGTGVAGIYGQSDLGVVTLDYALLGGVSGHDSSRKVVVGGTLETATASYSSWFIAPSLGVSMPVLSADGATINAAASGSYILGGVSGYTETTPGGFSVTVGGAPIGVFDGRLELNGDKVVGTTDAGDVTVHGKVGLMAQINAGGASLPISFAGGGLSTSTTYTSPGSVTYGTYAGIGLSAAIAEGLDFNAGADGAIRSDGTLSLSARAGLNGSF